MPLDLALVCILGLVATAVAGVFVHRAAAGRPLVYGLATLANLGLLAIGLYFLLNALAPASTTLPLGLPWLGARFRGSTRSPRCS